MKFHGVPAKVRKNKSNRRGAQKNRFPPYKVKNLVLATFLEQLRRKPPADVHFSREARQEGAAVMAGRNTFSAIMRLTPPLLL